MKRLQYYSAACLVFLYAPLLVLSVFSFNDSRVAAWRGLSFRWYAALPHDGVLIESTANSFLIATGTTIAATIIGTLCAYAIWKRRTTPWLSAALFISLITPEVVTGVSLLLLFQLAFRILPIQLGMPTVLLAHVSFSLVFVVSVVLGRLRTFDRTLEEAAADLGASAFSVLRLVTLPLLMPSIVAAALLCFTISFDDYVITSMVAGVDSQTLPMVIYAMARRGISPEVNALSTAITLGAGVLIFLASRLETRRL